MPCAPDPVGAFERYPKLKIVLGHMGEGLPFWLQRIDNRYLLEEKIHAARKLARLPSEYFPGELRDHDVGRDLDAGTARLSLDVLGVDRILFAADFPYENDAEAVKFMDGASVTEDEAEDFTRRISAARVQTRLLTRRNPSSRPERAARSGETFYRPKAGKSPREGLSAFRARCARLRSRRRLGFVCARLQTRF